MKLLQHAVLPPCQRLLRSLAIQEVSVEPSGTAHRLARVVYQNVQARVLLYTKSTEALQRRQVAKIQTIDVKAVRPLGAFEISLCCQALRTITREARRDNYMGTPTQKFCHHLEADLNAATCH